MGSQEYNELSRLTRAFYQEFLSGYDTITIDSITHKVAWERSDIERENAFSLGFKVFLAHQGDDVHMRDYGFALSGKSSGENDHVISVAAPRKSTDRIIGSLPVFDAFETRITDLGYERKGEIYMPTR